MVIEKNKTNSSLSISRQKELAYVAVKEAKLKKKAEKDIPEWKNVLSQKIPEKVISGLQTAFIKAFTVIFENGTPIISKTYSRMELSQNHQVQDFAVKLKGSRKELRRMKRMAEKNSSVTLAVTTAEGIGLGALGIGMPDIILFTGVLLKAAYESAIQYGFDYEERQEQFYILKMMEGALSRKEDWSTCNDQIDRFIAIPYTPSEEEFQEQIKRTASTFAVDMLLLKFIQGLPVIGILGGLGNPVYYEKIMEYVQVKYYKRYIYQLKHYV